MSVIRNPIVAGILAFWLGLGVQASLAHPPGTPVRAMPAKHVSATAYFSHSGQELFEDPTASVINTAGLSLDYSPVSLLQFGLFAGAGEFDVEIPPSRRSIADVRSFNSDFQFYGGGSMGLRSPAYFAQTTSLFLTGSVGFLEASDAVSNTNRAWMYQANAGLLLRPFAFMGVALGGQFYWVDGEQERIDGRMGGFANRDLYRALAGFEFYLPKKNLGNKGTPFIGLFFAPTGDMKTHDKLGLMNGAASVTLGYMTKVDQVHIGDEGLDVNDEQPQDR